VSDTAFKSNVANRFSAAAEHYAARASIQSHMADYARQFIPNQVKSALDIGCATGENTVRLAAKTVGVDLAEGMITRAQRRYPDRLWCLADMDNMPLADNSFELIFSSMAMQWTKNPKTVIAEVSRLLSNKGRAVILVPTNDSFAKLKHAYRVSELNPRLHSLPSADQWKEAARVNKMIIETEQVRVFNDSYSSIVAMLRSISAIGASATASTGSKLSKNVLKALEQNYPTDKDGQFSLDYHCQLFVLRKFDRFKT
jgi:malonyl-CoA O-methyltransferase